MHSTASDSTLPVAGDALEHCAACVVMCETCTQQDSTHATLPTDKCRELIRNRGSSFRSTASSTHKPGYVFFTLLQEKLPDALFRDFLRLFDIGLGVLFSICFLSFFLIYYWKRNDKDFMGLIFDIVLLFIVTVLAFAELGITGNGKRTIEDLQVILLPFEWVFALGCIIAMAVVEYTGKN
ncbi:hypothetical protein P4O66_011317, partial [Electrophorus voltai]